MNFEGDFLVWAALAVFVPLMLSVVIPTVYRTWVEYRSRTKALDVLRVYAEKGQEPPASVMVALAGPSIDRHMPPAPPGPGSRPSRANHMAHLAGSLVCGLGAIGIAWWRMPDDGDPGPLVIWAVIAAIFFAGSAAARLVGVVTTPSGPPPDGR
jgi:hypothetical protein